jgi:hypothetical protein
VVLTFEKGNKTEAFPAAFMRHNVADLAIFPTEIGLNVSLEMIRRLSPDSLSVVEFRSSDDISIAQTLYKYPLLGEQMSNAWNLNLGREFHMTDDKGLFETQPTSDCWALFEGKMVWQFDAAYDKPRYWISAKKAKSQLRGLAARRLAAAFRVATGLSFEQISELFDPNEIKLDHECYRLAFRDIAASTNERTMVATILPRDVFAGNTLNLASPWRFDIDKQGWQQVTTLTAYEMCYLTACLNSFVVDWTLRQKVTSHLNQFYVYQVPVPRITEGVGELHPIALRAARLTCTTPEFDELAQQVGLKSHRDGAAGLAERAELRAELDGLIAHLYGLTEAEFAHVLSAFPLVPEPVKLAALNAYRDVERGLIR